MDPIEVLSWLGLAEWVPLALSIMGLAAAITATFPAPTKPALAVKVWAVLNIIGANVRHARNHEAGDKAGLTGGTPAAAKPPD